jgi:hypothetical protein
MVRVRSGLVQNVAREHLQPVRGLYCDDKKFAPILGFLILLSYHMLLSIE